MLALCLSPLIWFGDSAKLPVTELPVVSVDRDDFTITSSCRLVVAAELNSKTSRTTA